MSYLARLKAKIGENPLPSGPSKGSKGTFEGFEGSQGGRFCRIEAGEDAHSESNKDAIEERAALCADAIPAIYLDAWARLNHQKPASVSDAEWRQALNDGALFLDAWGAEAAQYGWTAGDLFSIPAGCRPGGLVWFLTGALVEAFGRDRARLTDGRTIEREGV